MRIPYLSGLLAILSVFLTLDAIVLPLYSGHLQGVGENMQDTGAILSITRELLNGSVLYQQIYTPYGPISHAAYKTMASLFGNTPETYQGYTVLLAILVLASEYVLVRRFMSLPLALGFYILVISHFNQFVIIYSGFEALGIVLLAVFWVPPEDRTFVRSTLYGMIFGLIHFSKFGSDIVAAGAFILVDLLYLRCSTDTFRTLRSLLKSEIVILLSFLFLVGVGAWLMIARLDPAVAKDTLWPLYLGQSYSRFEGIYRYPYYLGILYTARIHLPMLIGLLACLVSGAALLVYPAFSARRDSGDKACRHAFPFPLLIPPLFFILACFVLLRHAWHYNQYGIYAALGTSLALCAFGSKVRNVTLCVLLPYLFIASWDLLKVPLGIQPAPVFAHLNTPLGRVLEGSPQLVAFYERLFPALTTEINYSKSTSSIAVFTDRPGIYYFANLPVAGRITWFLPAYLRPWEEHTEMNALSQSGALVIKFPAQDMTGATPSPEEIARTLDPLLPPSLVNAFSKRFCNPIDLGKDPSADDCEVWVFALSPASSP